MKKFLYLLPLAMYLVACSAGPSLKGKWTAKNPTIPIPADIIMDFGDSDFTQTLKISTPVELNVVVKGTYKIEKEMATLTPTSFTIDDSKAPAALKAQIQASKPQMEAAMMKPQSGTLKFEGDTATITASDGAINLSKIN